MSFIGIPNGTYDIKIGDSFFLDSSSSSSSKAQSKKAKTSGSLSSSHEDVKEFHTLRFDFKPKSLCSGTDAGAFIAFDDTDGVQIVVPIEKGAASSGEFGNSSPLSPDGADLEADGKDKEDTSYSLYKGSKKPLKGDKECLLTFDQFTGELHLERLSSNIVVKNTRDEVSSALRSEIKRIRNQSPKRKDNKSSIPPKPANKEFKKSHSHQIFNLQQNDEKATAATEKHKEEKLSKKLQNSLKDQLEACKPTKGDEKAGKVEKKQPKSKPLKGASLSPEPSISNHRERLQPPPPTTIAAKKTMPIKQEIKDDIDKTNSPSLSSSASSSPSAPSSNSDSEIEAAVVAAMLDSSSPKKPVSSKPVPTLVAPSKPSPAGGQAHQLLSAGASGSGGLKNVDSTASMKSLLQMDLQLSESSDDSSSEMSSSRGPSPIQIKLEPSEHDDAANNQLSTSDDDSDSDTH